MTAPRHRYASAPDSSGHNRILQFLPLVSSIARRCSQGGRSGLDFDDLVSAGTIGLIAALERFDASRGVPLEAYVAIRVRGAMIDALRQQDWVPRDTRRRGAQLGEARRRLSQRLGREPETGELAGELGHTPEELSALLASAAVPAMVSLDAPVSGESDVNWSEVLADERETNAADRVVRHEEVDALDDAIGRLGDQERKVMEMYYTQGLRYREIGAALGLCESRVCQIRSSALARLRQQINRRSMVRATRVR